MPLYHFQIFQGQDSNAEGQDVDLPDARAAWKEACFLCRDLSGGIFTDAKPEWKLEVADDSGRTIFRFRVLADVLSE